VGKGVAATVVGVGTAIASCWGSGDGLEQLSVHGVEEQPIKMRQSMREYAIACSTLFTFQRPVGRKQPEQQQLPPAGAPFRRIPLLISAKKRGTGWRRAPWLGRFWEGDLPCS
jgi:hypothetical protein